MAGTKKTITKTRTREQATAEVVRDLVELFEQKNPDGSLRFSDIDKYVVRSLMLLELVKAGELENFSDDRKMECALLFDAIGIYGDTDPSKIDEMVMGYFKSLAPRVNLDVFDELYRIRTKKENRQANKVAAAAEAFRQLTDDDGLSAPNIDDKPPEDSKPAGTVAMSLGVKVRI